MIFTDCATADDAVVVLILVLIQVLVLVQVQVLVVVVLGATTNDCATICLMIVIIIDIVIVIIIDIVLVVDVDLIMMVDSTRDEVVVVVVVVRIMLTICIGHVLLTRIVRARMTIGYVGVLVIGSKARARRIRIAF